MNETLDGLTLSLRPLIERYFHALDTRDFNMLQDCFLPESVMSYFGGEVVDHTRDAFVGRLKTLMTFSASTHTLSNMVLRRSGENLHGEIVATAHLLTANQTLMVRGLHYSDQYAKSDFGWRILRRAHRATWQFEVPAGLPTSPESFSRAPSNH